MNPIKCELKVKEEVDMETSIANDEEDVIDISLDNSSIKVMPSKVSNGSVSGTQFKCILDSCSNSACKTKPLSKLVYIKNCITIQIKKFIKQYYQVSF